MATPKQIGRYRVERVLGAGTFATVFLAHDDRLAGHVALKVLAENWSFDDNVKLRFIEEARILWRAQHDRIVRVHLVDELDDGRPFFVMDYADRGTLHDRSEERFSNGTGYSVEDALAIGREIAECLAVAHDLGIVHRDLKPSNILFRSTPARRSSAVSGGSFTPEQVMLADFGLAKRLESSGRTVVAGTPAYMPPEQADPDRAGAVDERVDIYSANVILYELLAGRPPYVGQTLEGVREAQARREPEPLDALRPDVPKALAVVLRRGLEPDPELRYRSAIEWADALSASFGSERRSSIVLEDGGDPAGGVAAACDRLVSRFGGTQFGGAVASARERLRRALRVTVVGEHGAGIDTLAAELARAGQLEIDPVEFVAAPGSSEGLDLPEVVADAVVLVLPESRDRVAAAGRALNAALARSRHAIVALAVSLHGASDGCATLATVATNLLTCVPLRWPAPPGGTHETLVPGAGADAVLEAAYGGATDAPPITTRELANVLAHVLVQNKPLLRADSGVAALQRALDTYNENPQAAASATDELERLALELPELAELDVLRADVCDRLTLPRGRRAALRRLLFERDPHARLGLPQGSSPDDVRRTVLEAGEHWRELARRAPYAERELLEQVARTCDRLWAETQVPR